MILFRTSWFRKERIGRRHGRFDVRGLKSQCDDRSDEFNAMQPLLKKPHKVLCAPCGHAECAVDRSRRDRLASALVFERETNTGDGKLFGAKPSAQLHDQSMSPEHRAICVLK